MILTTTDGVPGRQITGTLGIILACVPFWGSKYSEGITDLNGTTTSDIHAALERRRAEVLQRLARSAEGMGANAVVAVRMDIREITASWKELCAYGTAVIIK